MTKRLHEPPKIWLNLDICRTIYKHFRKQIEFDEPLPHFDERYVGRLEAILGTIQGSYTNVFYYPTTLDCAAAYLVKLNCRHPFSNGNKRISVLFTTVFLFLNDFELNITQEDMFNLAALIAKHHEKGMSESKHIEVCKKIIADFTTDSLRGMNLK